MYIKITRFKPAIKQEYVDTAKSRYNETRYNEDLAIKKETGTALKITRYNENSNGFCFPR